jgi:hypothetical protein
MMFYLELTTSNSTRYARFGFTYCINVVAIDVTLIDTDIRYSYSLKYKKQNNAAKAI